MSRWRILVLLTLLTAPFVFLMVMGTAFLWEHGWITFAWLPMMLFMAAAFGLAWYWQRKRKLIPLWSSGEIPHGTQRDHEALKLVEARIKNAETLPNDSFTDPNYYMQTAQEMALEMARFYHPNSVDPYGMLTVPEMLSVAELAAHDLNELVLRLVPGSHLLTIKDYKHARQAVDWYKKARNVYWLASAFINPLQTAARYLTSRLAVGGTWDLLQQNIVMWFYTAYVQRLGTYLIELHSGRLRVGVKRYRELIKRHAPVADVESGDAVQAPVEAEATPAAEVTITLVGQVNAGKSSLINALLGEQAARTDMVPTTDRVSRYTLQAKGGGSKLVLLDTQGFGDDGPNEEQITMAESMARQSDLIILVLHARNPARKGDIEMLDRLRGWFDAQPKLKMPPAIAVVSHIDLLTPAMEWSPPYDWTNPTRPKEKHISEAVRVARDQLGARVAAVVPACTQRGKLFGVHEAVLPVIVERLGEARSVALLRCLHSEADQHKTRRVFSQLLEVGREVMRALAASR